jgi:hypothetical protein
VGSSHPTSTRADRVASLKENQYEIDRKHYLQWLKSFFRLEIEQLASGQKDIILRQAQIHLVVVHQSHRSFSLRRDLVPKFLEVVLKDDDSQGWLMRQESE